MSRRDSESRLREESARERRKSRDSALKKNKILPAHQPQPPQNPTQSKPGPQGQNLAQPTRATQPPPNPDWQRGGLPLIYPLRFPRSAVTTPAWAGRAPHPPLLQAEGGLPEAQSIWLPALGPRGDGGGEADSEQVSAVEQLLSIRKSCICNACGSPTELREGVHPPHDILKGQRISLQFHRENLNLWSWCDPGLIELIAFDGVTWSRLTQNKFSEFL